MKGFPNQVADLSKLAKAMECIVALADAGEDVKDDGVLGAALVRAGVAGTGHVPVPIAQYLREQRAKPPSNQSFRTTARGLRELFRLLGFIDDSEREVIVTPAGRRAASFAGHDMTDVQMAFWRDAISNMVHDGGDGETSHPYQVLLRLVAKKPGITRARCALALEARNDSARELERIAALADLPEDEIRAQTGVSKSNWDNAKKVLPKFAEQLGDVVRDADDGFHLADAPGRADAGAAVAADALRGPAPRRQVRPPRTSRRVTPETIARAGTADTFDEEPVPPPDVDPRALAAAIEARLERLRRHNLLVQALAALLFEAGCRIYEDPYDVLAVLGELGLLVEVKTLDGTPDDERAQVRNALSQLLYYEAFVTEPVIGDTGVRKIACFDAPITDAHREWLNSQEIGVMWPTSGGFYADDLAAQFLAEVAQIRLR